MSVNNDLLFSAYAVKFIHVKLYSVYVRLHMGMVTLALSLPISKYIEVVNKSCSALQVTRMYLVFMILLYALAHVFTIIQMFQ